MTGGSYMLLSDRQKDMMHETAGIRNVDRLTQLPCSISSSQIFVHPKEVRDLVVSYEPRMGC